MSEEERKLLEQNIIYEDTIVELQEKINKAIEYIRHTDFVDKGYINFMYELENILRGEDKE